MSMTQKNMIRKVLNKMFINKSPERLKFRSNKLKSLTRLSCTQGMNHKTKDKNRGGRAPLTKARVPNEAIKDQGLAL